MLKGVVCSLPTFYRCLVFFFSLTQPGYEHFLIDTIHGGAFFSLNNYF